MAKEILRFPGSSLLVPLPLPIDDYLQDFETDASKKEFRHLLSMAEKVLTLPPASTRSKSYEAVGRYVVDHCDVLIALWDGKASRGRGGTAEIISYARKLKKAIYWIHTEYPDKVSKEGINESTK